MRYVFALMVSGIILSLAWWPAAAVAQDDASILQELVEQNVEVAYDPPQASSEALLKLPSVYIRPGSMLYWFKHVVEDVRLVLTSDPEEKSELMLEFSQKRLAEGYQALQDQDWESARAALEDYQGQQADLAVLLRELQQEDHDVEALLQLLREQLGLQQALQEYVTEQVPSNEQPAISSLLIIRPNQTLALTSVEQGALLGEQSSQSAQPSTTPLSSPSAQASPAASPAPSL